MTAEELAGKLSALTEDVDSLVVVSCSLDAEVPLYSIGSLALAVAALAELVVNRALEVYSLAADLRPDSVEGPGLVGPDVLSYVRSLIATGREPGAEAGVEAGRWS